MKSSIGILILLAISLFSSCRSKLTGTDELTKYLKDNSNGLSVQKEDGGIVYTLTYRPQEILALQECKALSSVGSSSFDSTLKVYKKYEYYLLDISAHGEDLSAKYLNVKMLSELAFHLDQLAFMTIGKDTIRMKDYNYSRLYGMTRNTSVLLCFEKKNEILSDAAHCLHILPIAGITNYIDLCIDEKNITSLPEIDLCKELIK